MSGNRLFVPQQILDEWLSEERVEVDGEILVTRPEGQRFKLSTAVLFREEVSGEGDPHALVGRVKDIEQLTALGAEHCADSVIYGENAYQVVEGFVGAPLAEDVEDAHGVGDSMSSAAQAALGERNGSGELDALARFLKSR
ncbi:MAG: hypothetical protein AB7S26_24670 [Sandaracinaceae bacterium]